MTTVTPLAPSERIRRLTETDRKIEDHNFLVSLEPSARQIRDAVLKAGLALLAYEKACADDDLQLAHTAAAQVQLHSQTAHLFAWQVAQRIKDRLDNEMRAAFAKGART